MNKKNPSEEWFQIAEMDLLTANYLKGMRPKPIEIICYHCQQAAEKYLKGFLAFRGHEVVKTHDLMALNRLCLSYDQEFKSIKEPCLRLTDYGVNIRYPYPIDLNESDMELALKDAQVLQTFVLKRMTLRNNKESK
ncbi:MAG TPA: HEPN domain-containing protein [candidate division Zixibacteria bacterium]|nr:HEPN domain-containing protein [candidate division Zixibacteria bacterium]